MDAHGRLLRTIYIWITDEPSLPSLTRPLTYSLSKSSSDFFCSVGESGDGGLSLSTMVGPAASKSRWGLARNWGRDEKDGVKEYLSASESILLSLENLVSNELI